MKNIYKLNLSRYSTHNIVRKMIGSDKIVLDVGCSEGYMGLVSDKSNKFYGLEINKESLRLAKRRYVDAIFYDTNNMQKLPWNIKFDVIVFADVLEHTLFPEQVLNFFIKSYLRKDGKIIVSVPNIANWEIRLKLLFGKFNYTDAGILDKTHLHFYTFKTARKLVVGNDLKIINIKSGSSLFGYIITLLPFLRGVLTTSVVLKTEKEN